MQTKTLSQRTIDDIQEQCNDMRGYTPEYYEKQMHKIPDAPVVDRLYYILEQCKDKHVLHMGCSWPPSPLHRALYEVTKCLDGMDISVPEEEDGKHNGRGGVYLYADFDEDPLESIQYNRNLSVDIELVVCGEIIEHLANPGNFLRAVHTLNRPVLITVPNAYSRAGMSYISSGIENVNLEHVSYYSYHTLKELVTRYGYIIEDFVWYNGRPGTAEGLIFLVR